MLQCITFDIIVDKNGFGDYRTLTEAVNNAKSGQTIFVRNGFYDNEIVNCIGKYLIINGESRDKVIIQNSYDDYTKPPLNIGKGIIKNMSFKQIGSNSETEIKSYAVHIDNPDLFNNDLSFYNCSFYSLTHASVGVGLYNNCKLTFNNCEFRSDCNETPQGEHRGALFVHNCINPKYAGNNQSLVLNNCKLYSLYSSVIHLEHCLDIENIATIKYSNCDLYSKEFGIKNSNLITQELNSTANDYNIIMIKE